MLKSKSYKLNNYANVQEHFHSHNWTDGLPVVPPTPATVKDLLEWSNIEPEHLIGIEPVRSRPITAEKLAINAVMAGCLPEHFPLVCESFSAMLKEPFLLHGSTASTGGCAILIIINGPIKQQKRKQELIYLFSKIRIRIKKTFNYIAKQL